MLCEQEALKIRLKHVANQETAKNIEYRDAEMKSREAGEFFERNPKMRRWLNECLSCHRKGYKPETPEATNRNLDLYKFRRSFGMLEVDEQGVCEQCREAAD